MILSGFEGKHDDHFGSAYDMGTLAERLKRWPANVAGCPCGGPRPKFRIAPRELACALSGVLDKLCVEF
jgi:hypothetical protein